MLLLLLMSQDQLATIGKKLANSDFMQNLDRKIVYLIIYVASKTTELGRYWKIKMGGNTFVVLSII